ncbi:MAG TPA: hypothetical protein VEO75_00745, partial [Nitrososphaerales archaeon]|nr:hypothetical protein [Nitrososphaerales archaeon]
MHAHLGHGPFRRVGNFLCPTRHGRVGYHGALIEKGETLYVMDRENNQVQLFSLKGEFISQWTDFAGPTGIALAEDGNLVLCEFGYDPAVPTRYSVPSHGKRILPRLTVRSP